MKLAIKLLRQGIFYSFKDFYTKFISDGYSIRIQKKKIIVIVINREKQVPWCKERKQIDKLQLISLRTGF